ncbi:MAG: V-type ATP synthase subunit D [Promethearchaeota archaeon]
MSSFSKVIPTKSQLLKLKRRLQFLEKGHDLLELKAETILIQIKKVYKNFMDRRKKTITEIQKAFEDLKRAELVSGEHALRTLADVNRNTMEYVVNIGYRTSYGFTVPKITYHIEQEKHFPHYGFGDTNFYLDRYYKKMQILIEELIKLAEIENTLFKLADEYRKVRRRTKALEDIIIPQTKSQITLIENTLDESMMEEFIRLKKTKAKIMSKK